MPSELGESLSERELDVVKQLALGAVNRAIADTLSISPNTVKVHLRNIYTKLGVTTRTEAVSVAMQQGFIPSPIQEIEIVTAASAIAQTNSELTALEPITVLPTVEIIESTGTAQTNWRLIAMISGLFALTILLIFWWTSRPGEAEPAADTFVELPIGDTNWRTSLDLPQPLSNMATATNGLNIYHIGGESEGVVVADVRIFDTSSYSWRSAAAKPTAVADATAAVLFGQILVPGGRQANGQPTAVVEAYSPVNDRWQMVASLPKAIAGALALTDGNVLYLIGGWDGTNYLPDTFVYDPGNDSWRPLPDLPEPVAFGAGAFVSGRLYVVGGYNGVEDLATCYWLDIVELTWNNCAPLLEARAGAAAAAIFDRLYIVGGGWHSEVTFSEYLDTGDNTWQVVNDPRLSGNSQWAHLGVNSVERRIYAMGGQLDNGPTRDNLVFVPFPYESFIPASSSSGD